jgi:hypothetical protein
VLPPKAGSATVLDHPTICHQYTSPWIWRVGIWGREVKGRYVPRARNLSSERIAIALMRRTETVGSNKCQYIFALPDNIRRRAGSRVILGFLTEQSLVSERRGEWNIL